MDQILAHHLVEMYLWALLLILVIFQWGHHHILEWEARAQEWDTVAPVQAITVWEVLALVTTAWEDPVQCIQGWEVQVLVILAWEVQVLEWEVLWEGLHHCLCPQRRFILLTNPWCSILRTPMLHPYIHVAFVTRKFMTMIR